MVLATVWTTLPVSAHAICSRAPGKLVASGAYASAILILGQYSIGEITHYQDRSLFYFGGQRAFTGGHLDIAAQALGNQAVATECRKRLAWRQSHAFKSTL